MSRASGTSRASGDSVERTGGRRLFDTSDTAWLVGQAVHYLNAADKDGEFAYLRVVELLRRCGKDFLTTVIDLFQLIKSGDTSLRFNLLYLVGDAGDGGATDFLVRTALEPLPEARQDEGCSGARDREMLVCAMAVHALHRVAARDPKVSAALLTIVSARPARPILIEAVKVASELGLKDKVRGLLPKEDHWMLDIRRARMEELFVDPERQDGKERGFTPPESGLLHTAPAVCCAGKEK